MTATLNLKPNQFINDRYKIVTALNHGSFGSVSLAKDTWSRNSLVAIKCIIKQKDDLQALQEAREEIAIHKRLGNHKYICSILDSFEDDEATYIVMEYCPEGDLYEAIRAGQGPTPATVLQFMLQLIEAVEYAHSRGVYHRDIKPENILIASDGSVRLADWGLATTIRNNSEFGVGSERYMAPELFDEDNTSSYDAEKVDIWSIGICLLNILFGRNPFTSACQKDKLFLDFASSREALFDIFPNLSYDTFSALRHALTLDPDNRSLESFREGLLDVEIWTVDEEEFYEESDEISNVMSSRRVSLTDSSSANAVVASSRNVSRKQNASSNFAQDQADKSTIASITTNTEVTPATVVTPVAVPIKINHSNSASVQDLTALATTAPPRTRTIRPPYNTPDSSVKNDGVVGGGNHRSLLSVLSSNNALPASSATTPSHLLSIVATTNDREPLRTPSVLSQQLLSESLMSQPWNRTMQFTPPNPSYFYDKYKMRQHQQSHHTPSKLAYNTKSPQFSQFMESVTEEDDEHFDMGSHKGISSAGRSDDEMFAMDEVDAALTELANKQQDDNDSVYSVPSLIASQDADDRSTNSSRRSGTTGVEYNGITLSVRRRGNFGGIGSTTTTGPRSVLGNKAGNHEENTNNNPTIVLSPEGANADDDESHHHHHHRKHTVEANNGATNSFDIFANGKSWTDMMFDDDDDEFYNETEMMNYMASMPGMKYGQQNSTPIKSSSGVKEEVNSIKINEKNSNDVNDDDDNNINDNKDFMMNNNSSRLKRQQRSTRFEPIIKTKPAAVPAMVPPVGSRWNVTSWS